MKMIKAIVRPEKCDEVLNKLCEAGYRAVTRFNILGRGKQRGLKVDGVYWDVKKVDTGRTIDGKKVYTWDVVYNTKKND